MGDRLQGTAWGCALRAAGTALPATRHCLDFFLCLDVLPSPGPSRLGNSLISLIPASTGAEPPPGPPHQGYHARTRQASDAWAPVVRDTQHQATKAAGHSQEAKQHHRHQCTTTGQGPAERLIWAGGSSEAQCGRPHPYSCPHRDHRKDHLSPSWNLGLGLLLLLSSRPAPTRKQWVRVGACSITKELM